MNPHSILELFLITSFRTLLFKNTCTVFQGTAWASYSITAPSVTELTYYFLENRKDLVRTIKITVHCYAGEKGSLTDA